MAVATGTSEALLITFLFRRVNITSSGRTTSDVFDVRLMKL